MKRFLFVCVLVITSADVFSQIGIGIGGGGMGMGVNIPLNRNNGPERSRNIEDKVQKMKKDLDLNKDQTIKLRSLLVERDRRSNGANLMKPPEFNKRLEEFLTPEQLTALKEKRQLRQARKQQPDTLEKKKVEENVDDVYY